MQPDFDADVDIVQSNLRAAQALYFSYMLEQTRLFDVVDRIVEQFQQGLLPLGRSAVASRMKRAALGRDDRQSFYASAFGAPEGNGGATAHREFDAAWLRFVGAVTQADRDAAAPTPLLSQASVRDAGRALAVHLSRAGAAVDHSVVQALLQSSSDALDIVGDAQMQQAFGASGPWAVVERVSASLGSPAGAAQRRTQAQSGASIIGWLTEHAAALQAQALEAWPSSDDAALVGACEQWLAMTGVADAAVEQVAALASGTTWPAAVGDALRHIEADVRAAVAQPGGSHDRLPSGISIVFRGPRGSGKTRAAQSLADTLQRRMVRIDLGQIASKYLGETEKELARILAEAGASDAVLLIDEADALFGKRTDVHSAHDRYANLAAASLRERLERHRGLAIVETRAPRGADCGIAGLQLRVVDFDD
jgi:hypothetical protein